MSDSQAPIPGTPVAYVPEEDDPIRPVNEPKPTSTVIPNIVEQKPSEEMNWEEKIAAARAAKEKAPVLEKQPDENNAQVETNETPVQERPEEPEVRNEQSESSQEAGEQQSDNGETSGLSEMNGVQSVEDEMRGVLDDTDADEPEEQPESKPEVEPKYDKNENEDPIMDVPVGNVIDDMTRLSAKYNPFMDKEVIRKRLREDPNDFYVTIMQMFATVGSSVELARDYLEKLTIKGIKLQKNPEGVADEIIRNKPVATGQPRRKLTGPEAKMAVLARAKGLRKVHLLNSGFWVMLRPMQLTELSQWYNTASMEAKDFGKLMGGHAFMFSDVLLKKVFMDILPSIIVDSNLEGWRNPERLSKMISIQDFDTLVWAECTLIYKQGVTVNLHCTNEECQFVAENVNVDLEKLRFNNLSAMSEEATKYLADQLTVSSKVSTENLKRYHKALGFHKDIVIGDVTYKCHVPSVNYFCQCGSEFVRMILASVKGLDNSVDNVDQGIESNVRLNIAKTYLPWVYKIVTPDFETEDKDAILTQLEQDVRSGHTLQDEILKYQYDTRISYFCYTMLECPRCHKTPSKSLEDYYPLDPTYLFFFLCSRQLSLMMS